MRAGQWVGPFSRHWGARSFRNLRSGSEIKCQCSVTSDPWHQNVGKCTRRRVLGMVWPASVAWGRRPRPGQSFAARSCRTGGWCPMLSGRPRRFKPQSFPLTKCPRHLALGKGAWQLPLVFCTWPLKAEHRRISARSWKPEIPVDRRVLSLISVKTITIHLDALLRKNKSFTHIRLGWLLISLFAILLLRKWWKPSGFMF